MTAQAYKIKSENIEKMKPAEFICDADGHTLIGFIGEVDDEGVTMIFFDPITDYPTDATILAETLDESLVHLMLMGAIAQNPKVGPEWAEVFENSGSESE